MGASATNRKNFSKKVLLATFATVTNDLTIDVS